MGLTKLLMHAYNASDRWQIAETRCIALSGSDREGSVEVCGKPFPTRTKV